MAIFLTVPGQIIFYVVGLLLFFLQPVTKQLIVRRHMPRVKARFNSASGVFLLLLVNLFVVAWFGYAEIGVLTDWAYYLGLSLSILANATYFWGHQSLGRYFSSMVVVYQGHQLVEHGPYRFVRHPMYSSVLLGSIGVGLMAQSWAALGYIVISNAILVAYRTSVEEKALISELGEQYISYTRRVKRLIPFIF